MATINQSDFIQSVADALQYISYYHPEDFITNLTRAYELEQSPAAKDAMAQILINSRMCAEGHRPICQDTGIVTAFIKLGMETRWDNDGKPLMTVQQMVDEGVRRAYNHPDNKLRASILADPAFSRKNTGDNTPSVVSVEMVPGGEVDVTVAAKGGGSEAKSKFVMLNPSDSIVDWVLKTVPTMGAGWCPPGMLGIGIGGTAEKAMVMAKESLMDPIDMQELKSRGPQNQNRRTPHRALRQDQQTRHRRAGPRRPHHRPRHQDPRLPHPRRQPPRRHDPQLRRHPPRHIHLDGSGPVALDPPSLESWPSLTYDVSKAQRVNLDTVTHDEVRTWKPGEVLLLSGKLLTGRDAAHKRMTDMLNRGEKLPVDLKGRFIYYVGPVDAVRDEAVGPAGPTTATRMDKFTRQMLDDTGLYGMVGKAERGPAAIEAIRDHQAVYLMAVGGAAYLVSKAIKSSRVLAFADLGMEAIYEFDVKDMPVTVAVDSQRHQRPQHRPRRMESPHRRRQPRRHPHPAMTHHLRCRRI